MKEIVECYRSGGTRPIVAVETEPEAERVHLSLSIGWDLHSHAVLVSLSSSQARKVGTALLAAADMAAPAGDDEVGP